MSRMVQIDQSAIMENLLKTTKNDDIILKAVENISERIYHYFSIQEDEQNKKYDSYNSMLFNNQENFGENIFFFTFYFYLFFFYLFFFFYQKNKQRTQ